MRYVIRCALAFVVTTGVLFLGATTEARNKPPACASTTGVASFYAGQFIGRKTASGDIFTAREMTAAHRTLPFGTKLKLTNPKTGKTVQVVINDRGPYVKGRILDLSLAAAEKLGFVKDGLAKVKIESCASR